ELEHWRQVQSAPSLLLTEGRLDPRRDTLGSAGRLSLTLPVEVTETLLTKAPAVFHGNVNDVLLGGLAVAVADWCRRQAGGGASGGTGGGSAVLLDLEGHGREQERFGDADLSRTVGWFTSLYPVRLDLGGLDGVAALAGGAALSRAVKA